MPAKKKISRKELKRPDEFLSFWARTFEFARIHVRKVLIGVGSVLVLALLIWAWSAYSERQEARASRLLVQAQALLQTPFVEGREEKAGGEEVDQAFELLEDLVRKYKRTKAWGMAQILLGQLHYEKRDYDAGIAAYDAFLKRGDRKPELTAMAWEGIAYSQEAKQDFAAAVTYYEKIRKMSLAQVKAWAYLGIARCYERLDEYPKALDAYRALLADHPQHPRAQEARASILRITQSMEGTGPTAGPPEQPQSDQTPGSSEP